MGGTIFQPERRRDRELTLGPATVLALGLGLLGLCGVCFVFGYAVGRQVPPKPAAALSSPQAAASPASLSASTTGEGKPAATQTGFGPKPSSVQANEAAKGDSVTEIRNPVEPQVAVQTPTRPQIAAVSSSPAAPQCAAPAAAPVVVATALPRANAAGSPAAASRPAVRPALPQSSVTPAGSWMVQVAAVSHPEDAEVLLSALQKHGYAVAEHRDPVDTLIHVQVGPFSNHNDAVAMRQKLLNDGYNAIIQP